MDLKVTFKGIRNTNFELDGDLGDGLTAILEVSVEFPDGRVVGGLALGLKRAVGEDDSSLELVLPPHKTHGVPLNYFALQQEASAYYLRLIGPNGLVVRIPPGTEGAAVIGMHIDAPYSFVMTVAPESGKAW